MKTKVIEFINRIQDGGAETLIKDYALLLDKESFDVKIVCCFARKNSAIYKTLKDNNVEIIELYGNTSLLFRALARVFRKLNAYLLRKELRKDKPNVLHVHLEMLETINYIREDLQGVKLFYTCHNLPKTLIGEDLPREKKATEELIKSNGLRIIALHKEMADEINARFNIDNTAVIKNGIDFNKFLNNPNTKEAIRERLNISKDSYVVGSVGRLTYQKNPEFTIEVFKELLKINPKAFLIIVGSGPLENKVKELIQEYELSNSTLLLANRDDMPDIYKAMDVFIFPSRYEGLGIVLIEAQISNIPSVISGNIPKEAFQSNLITKLKLEDAVSSWAEALNKPIANVYEYGDISEYDMNKEIKKLEELYKQ